MDMFSRDVCALSSVDGDNRALLMDAARNLAGAFTDLLNVARPGSDEVSLAASKDVFFLSIVVPENVTFHYLMRVQGVLYTAVYADVFERPPPRLASRRPMWSDMTSVLIITQWREDWSLASVVNHTIVTDPTMQQPSFDLPSHTWSLLNHFQAGQGPCHANLHKWGLAQSPSCDCGQRQTMNHIVDM